MQLSSADQKSKLAFDLVEIEKRLPSLCISVTIQNDGFAGFLPTVWIEWDLIRKFLEDTKQYSYKNAMIAQLVSMTPDEMELSFHKENGETGTMDFKLSKWVYVSEGARNLSLSGGFEFNRTSMDELRNFFLQIEHEFSKNR